MSNGPDFEKGTITSDTSNATETPMPALNTVEDPTTTLAPSVIRDRHSMTAGWDCLVKIPSSESKSLDREACTESLAGSSVDLEKQYAMAQSQHSVCSSTFASITSLKHLEESHPLPRQLGNASTRFLRWRAFSSYRKLLTLILVLNISAMIVFLALLRHPSTSALVTYDNAATAASANFFLGICTRNEHVVNLFFHTASMAPHWVPLALRRRLAKVYSYGGLHSGCGISGFLWYLVFFGLLIADFHWKATADLALTIMSGLLVAFLVIMLWFAHPRMRVRYHDHFEMTHRFLGWTSIAILWAQAMLLVSAEAAQSQKKWWKALLQTPTFWFLVVITACLIYPWVRLRLRKVQAEVLSMHAIRLRFDYASLDTCYGIRLSTSPLTETHSFATIPNANGQKGFSVMISAAGDWTRDIIRNPPSQIWTRGAPVIGVARVGLMFRKILLVATGTGIGPCLSFIQARPDYPLRMLWSARRPAETYDAETIDAVLRADPDAVIIDSDQTGRCNLLALAYSMFLESDAEAVIVISNPKVVKSVVGGLETRYESRTTIRQ